MKENKKIIKIKDLFQSLLSKNIISILIIGIIIFPTIIFYNLNTKQIVYNYSTIIMPTNIWVSDKIIIEKKLVSQYYGSFYLQKFFSELPLSVIDKKFVSREDGGIFIVFKSIDIPVDISSFLSQLNEETRLAVLKTLNSEYESISRQFTGQKNINLEEVAKLLKDYPEILKIQKLESALNNQYQIDKEKMALGMKLAEIVYFIKNFDEFFSSDMYFSLNGWKITDNKSNNSELFFLGLMFWLLFSSFFLFFKSKYFREKLRN
jgi:hypothetical protein